MRYLNISFLFLMILLGSNSNPSAQTSCINCHLQLEDQLKTPTDNLTNDSHLKSGISCEGCHGGDADSSFAEDLEAAMDAKKAILAFRKEMKYPNFVSKCHSDATYIKRFNPNLPTDQYQQYLTSQHGMKLVNGDTKVAVCTDCHRNS